MGYLSRPNNRWSERPTGASGQSHTDGFEGKLIQIAQSVSTPLQELLETISSVKRLIDSHPYCLPPYVLLAKYYRHSGYPDLAAGAAYKALLLSDAVQDDSDEYHEQAVQSLLTVLTALPSLDANTPSIAGYHAEHGMWVEDGSSQATNMVISLYLPIMSVEQETSGLALLRHTSTFFRTDGIPDTLS